MCTQALPERPRNLGGRGEGGCAPTRLSLCWGLDHTVSRTKTGAVHVLLGNDLLLAPRWHLGRVTPETVKPCFSQFGDISPVTVQSSGSPKAWSWLRGSDPVGLLRWRQCTVGVSEGGRGDRGVFLRHGRQRFTRAGGKQGDLRTGEKLVTRRCPPGHLWKSLPLSCSLVKGDGNLHIKLPAGVPFQPLQERWVQWVLRDDCSSCTLCRGRCGRRRARRRGRVRISWGRRPLQGLDVR